MDDPTEALLTTSHAALIEMLSGAREDVWLASPFVSLPVALELAGLAAASSVPWSLLTNIDPAAIANGYLSTAGLRALMKAGVAVRTDPSLHAKIYLTGSAGIAGSGNLTQSGLGVGGSPNLEVAVRLSSPQVAAAMRATERWWTTATVVDEQLLRRAEADACKLPVVSPPRRLGDEKIVRETATLLGEARGVNLWVKALYGDQDPPDWTRRGTWISSSKKGRPSFAVNDLVLIYARDLHVCNAILQITREARYAPEILLAAGRSQEHAERWPWVNYVKGRMQVGSQDAVTPAELGFKPQGLQSGHRRLDLAEFAAAVRHLGGERSAH